MAEVTRICTETIYEIEDVPLVTPQSGHRVSIHAISFGVGGFSIKMPQEIAGRLAERLLQGLPEDTALRAVRHFRTSAPSPRTAQLVGAANDQ